MSRAVIAMAYRQFILRTDDGLELTCWLKDDPRLWLGRRLTLKDDPLTLEWHIAARYLMSLDALPERRWNIGGLL